MDAKTLVPLFVQISLTLIVGSVGLRCEWRDLTTALSQPRRLLRGIVAINVFVPLAALLIALVLPMDQPVKQGIVIMAVSPLAPLIPGRLLKAGAHPSVAVGMFVCLLLLAVVIVPLSVALLTSLTQTDVFLPAGAIAWLATKTVIAPLLGGVLVARLLPGLAPRLAKIAGLLGNLILLPFAAAILYLAGGEIVALAEDGTLLACVVVVVVALAGGHLIGGPEPLNKMALGIAAATRHPGIAVMIARSGLEDRRVVMAVLMFLFVSVIVSGIYQFWVMRRIAGRG